MLQAVQASRKSDKLNELICDLDSMASTCKEIAPGMKKNHSSNKC